jgi:hypothetical protein
MDKAEKIVAALIDKPGLVYRVKKLLREHRVVGSWEETLDSNDNKAWARFEAGGDAVATITQHVSGSFIWKALTATGETRTARQPSIDKAQLAADDSMRRHGDYTFIDTATETA